MTWALNKKLIFWHWSIKDTDGVRMCGSRKLRYSSALRDSQSATETILGLQTIQLNIREDIEVVPHDDV